MKEKHPRIRNKKESGKNAEMAGVELFLTERIRNTQLVNKKVDCSDFFQEG